MCTCDIEERGAHCAACHESFRGVTNFDAHQRLHDGRSHCRPPADVGMVVRRTLADGTRVWGRPPAEVRPAFWR